MTRLSIKHGELIIEVVRDEALWALRSQLEIPLNSIAAVAINPSLALRSPQMSHGQESDGHSQSVSRFVRVGDVYFWDVTDPARTVAIILRNVPPSTLVLQLDDPAAAIDLIEVARRTAMPPQH